MDLTVDLPDSRGNFRFVWPLHEPVALINTRPPIYTRHLWKIALFLTWRQNADHFSKLVYGTQKSITKGSTITIHAQVFGHCPNSFCTQRDNFWPKGCYQMKTAFFSLLAFSCDTAFLTDVTLHPFVQSCTIIHFCPSRCRQPYTEHLIMQWSKLTGQTTRAKLEWIKVESELAQSQERDQEKKEHTVQTLTYIPSFRFGKLFLSIFSNCLLEPWCMQTTEANM